MKCEEIQELLMAYFSGELGRPRATLVREHLRKCPDCRSVALEIQTTLALLRTSAEGERNLPMRLTDDRRARLRRAFLHPVLDWIYQRHVIASLLIALIALIVLICRVCHMQTWNLPAEGITVTVGTGTPPETGPAAVGINPQSEKSVLNNEERSHTREP